MMDYRVINKSSGEDENSIEAHVLARAYRAVWRCSHGCEPTGQHPIEGLELVIDFGGHVQPGVPSPYSRAASNARRGETSTTQSDSSASVDADGRPDRDVTSDLWTRVRQFGRRMPSEELDQLIAELRSLEQSRTTGSRKDVHCRNRRRDD
jgi:hypothetical protein